MSREGDVVTWAACVMGVLLLILGLATLGRRRVLLFRTGDLSQWRSRGWSQILVALFVLLETGPRLAGASAVVVELCSIVALVPLIAALVVMTRVRTAHDS